MAALLKKIQHIQGFLKGAQALESFEKLREDQFKQCSDFISGSKGLSLESVSSILGVLDASVWNAEQLTELKTTLSGKLTRSSAASEPQSAREPSPPKQKASGQDYRNLVYHLKPCHYEMLANSKPDCLQALALHAAALGLRNPSEGTLAVLVTLLGWQGFKEEGLELASGYALLVEQKPKFKKLLAAAAPTASEADCLSVLPASWESLPETLRKAAYSDGVFPEEHPQFISRTSCRLRTCCHFVEATVLCLSLSHFCLCHRRGKRTWVRGSWTCFWKGLVLRFQARSVSQACASFLLPGIHRPFPCSLIVKATLRLRARPPGLWPCKTHPGFC